MSDLPSEESSATTTSGVIRTPDQRLRVFVSSTLQELADERAAARDAITKLRLTPVLFELGARPHPPRDLYRAYLDQSHIFLGIYWQRYGWVAPGMDISGLEDEYRLATSGSRPKLIYFKTPAPDREPQLKELIERIRQDDAASYKSFTSAAELRDLIENDLAVLLTEHFESTQVRQGLSVETRDRRTPPPLPEPLTRFIGRTGELAELERLLPTTRLLTLTGAGGTGKTRLALELATRAMHHHADAQADAYADGAWLAELAALSDPTALPQTLVALLGLREEARQPALATLTDGLRDKHLLLILDNCEHLIEACARLVETVLRRCQAVRILTTSRETLGIPGELAWRVPSLQTPDPTALLGLPELEGYEAVRLFVDRATLAAPGFELNASNAAAVQGICARLEGIPLAIELAAAQLKVMSAEEIAARLNDRLRLLTGGSRTAMPRQQTLRALIDWSYRLLSEPERTVLQRLSVFAGGWTLEAAEHVCQGGQGEGDGIAAEDVLGLLTRLLDQSLVVMSTMSANEGVTRYHLLETIRQYAAEKLDEAGESSGVRDGHLDYFLTLGERDAPSWFVPFRPISASLLKRLARDLDNVRRATEWAGETGQIEKGLRLIMAMEEVFFRRAGQKEFVARLQTLLEHPAAAHNTRAEAQAYHDLAWVQFSLGKLELSRASLERAEAVTFTPDDPLVRAEMIEMRSFYAQELGDYALARAYLDQWRAFVLSHNLLGWDQETFEAWEAENYGSLSLAEGDYAQAKACYERFYEYATKAGNKLATAWAARNLGYALLYSGDVSEAAEQFRESLTITVALEDTLGVAECLAACGAYALAQGALHPAARLFGASEQLQALLNTPLNSWDARRVQRNLTALRQQLAPAELEASWLAGRAMTLEQAVEYALSCLNEPIQGRTSYTFITSSP